MNASSGKRQRQNDERGESDAKAQSPQPVAEGRGNDVGRESGPAETSSPAADSDSRGSSDPESGEAGVEGRSSQVSPGNEQQAVSESARHEARDPFEAMEEEVQLWHVHILQAWIPWKPGYCMAGGKRCNGNNAICGSKAALPSSTHTLDSLSCFCN